MCLSDKYLQENGNRIHSLGEVQPGELLAVGLGSEGYRGFVVPENMVKLNGDCTYARTLVYEVPSLRNPEHSRTEMQRIVFDSMVTDILGVYEPKQGSELRATLLEKLGIREAQTLTRQSDPELDAVSVA